MAAEMKGESLESQYRHGDELDRDQSWNLEREFAKDKEMDLKKKLQMKQRVKEERILESVRHDLKHFQETLHMNGSPEKKQSKPRESLLPPNPTRKTRKSSPSRTAKESKNQQRLGCDDRSKDELDGNKCVDSEDGDGGGGTFEENIIHDSDGDNLETRDGDFFSSTDGYSDGESEEDGETEYSDSQVDSSYDMEYYDGQLNDSDMEDDDHSDTETQISLLTELSHKTEANLEGEANYQDHLSKGSNKSDLGQGQKTLTKAQSHANVRAAIKTIVNMDPLATDLASNDSSRTGSRGMAAGSNVPKSRHREQQQQCLGPNEIGLANDLMQSVNNNCL